MLNYRKDKWNQKKTKKEKSIEKERRWCMQNLNY